MTLRQRIDLDLERRLLEMVRKRDDLYERIDAFNSTPRERAALLTRITEVNKRIYALEREKVA